MTLNFNILDGVDREVVAYHGTTKSAADSILGQTETEDYWKPSRNKYDWLGQGAYFFQDAPLRAMLSAEKAVDRNKLRGLDEKPAIIESRFRLGMCLDLFDVGATNFLRLTHDAGIRERGKEPKPRQLPATFSLEPRNEVLIGNGRHSEIPQERLHLLDRAVVDRTVDLLEAHFNIAIDTVRSGFSVGHPAFSTSWLYDKAHVQISVRNIRKCLIGQPRLLSYKRLCELREELNNGLSFYLEDRN